MNKLGHTVDVRSRRMTGSLWVLVGLSLAVGCAEGPPKSAPVNANIARDTLTAAMDSWKFGETPASLQELTPSIVVQDLDWENGLKLVDYEVVDDSREVNANLYAKVKLTLEDPNGEKSEKTVTYVVGTSPVLTVFRDSFQ
jgi:hypothetical protein